MDDQHEFQFHPQAITEAPYVVNSSAMADSRTSTWPLFMESWPMWKLMKGGHVTLGFFWGTSQQKGLRTTHVSTIWVPYGVQFWFLTQVNLLSSGNQESSRLSRENIPWKITVTLWLWLTVRHGIDGP